MVWLLIGCAPEPVPVSTATLEDLAIEVDTLVAVAEEGWGFETLPYSEDLCTPIPRDPGPYASDSLGFAVEVVDVNSEAYVEVVPYYRYTPDGRRGFASEAVLGKPATRTTGFLPLDWRTDWSVLNDHTGEWATDWTWEGSVGTATSTDVGGDVFERTTIYRADGLPLQSETTTWTYVNDESWQIAEIVEGDRVTTYTWSCLTATIRWSDRDRIRVVSYMPDGRTRFSIEDTDGNGLPNRSWGLTYLEDSWRIDEEGDLLDPAGGVGRIWQWGP